MTSFNFKKNNKGNLAFVYVENEDLRVAVIDPDTEKCVESILIKKETTVDNISKQLISPKFKAIFLATSGFKPAGYSCNYEFCKELKTKFNAAKIPSHFFTDLQWHLSGLLISTGFIPKIDDLVIFVTEFGEHNIYVYKFTSTGYVHKASAKINISTAGNVPEEIFRLCRPEVLFTIIDASAGQRFKNIFMKWKVLSCKKNIFADPKYIIGHSKWLFDKTNANYYVQALSAVEVTVNQQSVNRPSNVFKIGHLLPASSTTKIIKIVDVCNLLLKDKNDEVLTTLATWIPDQNAYHHEITLSIDDEGFVDCQIIAILLPHFVEIPMLLNKDWQKRGIPVITFYDNLSFICVHKNVGYEYLKSWNGSFGKDLYISFDEEKPKYFQDAVEVARTKPTFVVFDIFIIMGLSPDYVRTFWGYQFKLTKDDDNPLLFEFDNFDGTRKFSTPAFLMALLLKQHFKAIKEESGEKPKEIAICTIVDYKDEEFQRIQTQMTEACEMLKVSCIFLSYTEMIKIKN